MVYSVFVGQYKTVNDSKSDLKKLQKLEINPYLFNKKDFYTFKIKSFLEVSKANQLKANLIKLGFAAFIEESNIN